MKMNLQKAMKARNLLKAEIAEKIALLESGGAFEKTEVKKAEFSEALRAECEQKAPLAGVELLDGKNRDAFYGEIAELQSVLYKLNAAIEKSNQACHILLMEETYVKSRLALAQRILALKRGKKVLENFSETEFVTSDGRTVASPCVRVNAFAYTKDFLGEVKALQKRLSEIRDEISALNVTTEIEADLPDEFV